MNFPYIIFELSFLVWPCIALMLSNYIPFVIVQRYYKLVGFIFLLHNLFFYFRYSLNGDQIDYIIFSLEYFFLCLMIVRLTEIKPIRIFKVIRIFGLAWMIVNFIAGCIGIILFLVISQDYQSDRIYNFTSNHVDYEIRRYVFGFATLSDTRYTFETYQHLNFLPIEKFIDKTDFLDTKSNLNPEGTLSFEICKQGKNKVLIFKSNNGASIIKKLD